MSTIRKKSARSQQPQRAIRQPEPAPDAVPVVSAPAWHWWLATVVVVAASIAVYAPTLNNDFVNWDDPEYITHNK